MSSDEQFVDDREAAVPETNLDAAKEDKMAEESEVTGKVSQGEYSTNLVGPKC